jgi:tetratricopeptide (TPR) repeat protein
MADSHFEVLGIPMPKDDSSFDEKELKSAFLKKVRLHPPHKSPEKYKQIRQAFECLNSTSERQAYVANLKSGGQITSLQNKIDNCFQTEDWQVAISNCKRLIVLDSDNLSAINQLGLAYANSGEEEEANKVFTKLNAKSHSVALYHFNQGTILLELAYETEQNSYCSKARHQFEKAINIDPSASESYLGIARIEFKLDRMDSGISWCKKAIAADGETDFQDFDAYFLICEHLAINDKTSRFNSNIAEMEQILTEETADYAAAHFAMYSQRTTFTHHNPKVGHLFSKAAIKFLKKFSISNQPIRDLHKLVVHIDNVRKEADKIENRHDVLVAVQTLVRVKLLQDLQVIEDHKAEEHYQEISNALDTWSIHEVERSFKYVKKSCPATYKDIKDYVDHILNLCNSSSNSSDYQPTQRRTQPQHNESGCLVFFIILAIGFKLAEII